MWITDATSHAARVLSLSTSQVKSRLRSLGQPVTLFAETDEERRERLVVALTERDTASNDDHLRLGAGGTREGYEGHGKSRNDDKDDDDDDDDGDEEEQGERDGDGKLLKKRKPNDDELFGRVKFSAVEGLAPTRIVHKYFKMLVKWWEADLAIRDDAEKRSPQGRRETQLEKQCKDHIRPLFKLCKKNTVPQDILDKLVKIVQFSEEGNFKAAHDQYILVAIGNAGYLHFEYFVTFVYSCCLCDRHYISLVSALIPLESYPFLTVQ